MAGLILPHNGLIRGGGAQLAYGELANAPTVGSGRYDISVTLPYDGVLFVYVIADASIISVLNAGGTPMSREDANWFSGNRVFSLASLPVTAQTLTLSVEHGGSWTDVGWVHYPWWDSDGAIINITGNSDASFSSESTTQSGYTSLGTRSHAFVAAAAMRLSGAAVPAASYPAGLAEYADADLGVGPNSGYSARMTLTELRDPGHSDYGITFATNNLCVALARYNWDATEQI